MFTDAITDSSLMRSSSLYNICLSLNTLKSLRNLKNLANFISFKSYGVLIRFSLSEALICVPPSYDPDKNIVIKTEYGNEANTSIRNHVKM